MSKKSKKSKESMAETFPDFINERIEQLKTLFPEAVNEGKVDFEKLRQSLGEIVDDRPERYSFTWAGKKDAIRLLQTPSRATLVPVPEESVNFDLTSNLFIEGDNLEVLKLLYKSYARRVKMIYIDPPYNTGNDFVYRDNFTDPLDTYLEITGQKDSNGNHLSSNTETNGRYHSAWLNMMYPRLFVARQLLREDGVIFVSIDDNEVHNLRMLMNEIFGEENFLAEFVWEGALKNDSRFVSVSHDYIICYAKNMDHLRGNESRWRIRKEGIDVIYSKAEALCKEFGDDYERISTKLKEWFGQLNKNEPAWQHRHYNRVDENGVYFAGDISWPGGGGPNYEICHPHTGKPVKVPARGWVYSKKERLLEMISDDRVEFGPDESSVPKLKRYLHETEGQVLPSVIYKDRRASTKRLRNLFQTNVFKNPKDEEILVKFIEATTNEKDIILDFFAGSGTTAQAVLELNREDGGNRQFIMVQLPEPTKDKSPAKKAGFDTIADIGKERIRRVIAKMNEEQNGELSRNDRNGPEDLGFKVFKLAESNFRQWTGVKEQDIDLYIQTMEMFIDPLLPDWKPENVRYEVARQEGYSLNATIEELTSIKTNTIHRITDAEKDQFFYISLDPKFDLQTVKALELEQGLKRDDLLIVRDVALTASLANNILQYCRLKTI